VSGHNPTQYPFKCPECGFRWEDFWHMDHDEYGPPASTCPECGTWGQRTYSVPVALRTLGKHMHPAITPEHRRRPQNAAQERRVWDAQKAAGVSLHPAPGKG
jgi:hypothetical protein